MKIRIAIIDDHSVLAEAIAFALSSSNQFSVHNIFTSPLDAIAACSGGCEADIVLADYSMPGMTGLEFCVELKKLRPALKCILLTMHDAPELRYKCRRAGIEGYIVKTTNMAQIRDYIQAVHEGFIESSDATSDLHDTIHEGIRLSPSEIGIIKLIVCSELTSKEIAEHLHRSHHTVEQHRKNIYQKLGIDSVAALTKYALDAGICNKQK